MNDKIKKNHCSMNPSKYEKNTDNCDTFIHGNEIESEIIENNNIKNKKKSTKQLLIHLMFKVGIITIVLLVIFLAVLGVNIHYGNNMHPSIRDGELVISYRLQKPYLNAAVMYKLNGKNNVGRVIAMEGDIIDIEDDGTFKINNIVPTEEVFYPTYKDKNSVIHYPYKVPAGKVFILNDFRKDTNDSRRFGAVSVKKIKGPIIFTMRRRGF